MDLLLPDSLMVGFDSKAYKDAVASAAYPGDIDPEDFIDYKPFEECQITDLRHHIGHLLDEFNGAFADLYALWSMLRVLEAMPGADEQANCNALCERFSSGGSDIDKIKRRLQPDIDKIRSNYQALIESMESALPKTNTSTQI